MCESALVNGATPFLLFSYVLSAKMDSSHTKLLKLMSLGLDANAVQYDNHSSLVSVLSA